MTEVINRKPIFDAVRSLLRDRGQGTSFSPGEVQLLDGSITTALGIAPPPSPPQVGLTRADFIDAAAQLGCAEAQIRAVWEVECSGSGWFTDIRGDILALDGPGGFLDGANLPKILFEAHHFSRLTKGRYNATYPNISSAKWNRKLYVGGQGEWIRLYNAMKLDREAALMSASVGAPQIMGFNYKLAGFTSVDEMWEKMKQSEKWHLWAFVNFIKNSGLVDELRRISTVHADCAPFARGYNGEAYAANSYHIRIAQAFKKWSLALEGK